MLVRRKCRKIIKDIESHPSVIPVATFCLLFGIVVILFVSFNSSTVGASDAKVVILYADNKTQSLPTRATTVSEFLKNANVILHEGDIVEPASETEIADDYFHINVYRAKPVAVIENGRKVYALSAATTPRSIAAAAGVTVYPEDGIISRPTENFVRDGTIAQQIIIERAVPANLNLYGSPVQIRSHSKTVGQLLHEKKIILEKDDSVVPEASTALTPNIQIFVTRSGTKIATVEESIAMPTETVEDPALTFGSSAVRQKGSPGKKMVTYQIALKNGKETGRLKIQEVIVVEPVKQIMARGKAIHIPSDKGAWMSLAGIQESDYPYVNYIISRESGWCPTKWQGQIGYCPTHYEDLHPINSGFGFGLCQSTPAQKMASAGADWQSNPVTQLKWCSNYAHARYKSWQAAYNHWTISHNW